MYSMLCSHIGRRPLGRNSCDMGTQHTVHRISVSLYSFPGFPTTGILDVNAKHFYLYVCPPETQIVPQCPCQSGTHTRAYLSSRSMRSTRLPDAMKSVFALTLTALAASHIYEVF